MLELVAAATGTALATGLGAIPVFLLGDRAAGLRAAMTGVASGVMIVAAIVGLLLPALDAGSWAQVGLGLLTGVVFLLVVRRALWRDERSAGLSRDVRSSVLVFAVLTVHSLPEGFAIGTAYASTTAGLGLFVVIAIAIQNIPEGTSVAIPMAAAGFGPARQFWAAVATSLPQPVGAVVAYLLVEQITALLPVSFAFAAGAMLALVVAELLPDAFRSGRRDGVLGTLFGAALMLALGSAVGVGV